MRRLAIILVALLAAPSLAGELSIGAGAIGLDDDAEAAGLAVDVRAEPFRRFGPTELRLGVGAEFDTDADFWIGAGLVVIRPLADAWRVEVSLMPGLYAQGDGLDLGSVVEFRSLIGVSRRIAPDTWLGVSISHKSNAGIDDTNPGEEAVLLHLSRRF
ncbi:MAG: acyloxyacyl hydrolase [Pseudomonadota bacterium]